LSSYFTLRDTSLWPYFVIMALFVLEAAWIQRTVPFFKRALDQEQADKKHVMQLDGLRGLLALSVFFTHAESFRRLWRVGSWGLPDSGFYAQLAVAPVAMFFLITGYLFWTKAQNTQHQNWRTFFVHRVRRLVPAYLFAVLFILLIVFRITHFQLRVPVLNIARSLVGYLSFGLLPTPAFNGFEGAGQICAYVFWSLRVEWMFYLAYPFMAFFARTKRSQLLLLIIAIALQFGLPIVRQHMTGTGKAGTLGLGTVLYFDFFLLSYFSVGMLAAYLKKHHDLKLFDSTAASLVAIAVTAAVLFLTPPDAGLREGLLLGVPFVAVIFGNSFFGLLRLRPLILLGQISYSTYLLHAIVLYVGSHLLPPSENLVTMSPLAFWLYTAVIGLFVVALSAFSYRYFEAPFMKGYGVKKTPAAA
jgi:peptidoglycan/LPS O-acetylase OafA/YrhL